MTDAFIIKYIDKKLKESEDENYIRYTFYELRIKNNLTEEEIDRFLKVNRDYFENHNFKVYFTGARYEYNGGTQNVQANELMIAFKE